jgi:hypothetical protein
MDLEDGYSISQMFRSKTFSAAPSSSQHIITKKMMFTTPRTLFIYPITYCRILRYDCLISPWSSPPDENQWKGRELKRQPAGEDKWDC